MSVIYHPSLPPTMTHPRRRLAGCGTKHGNTHWITAVRALRAALIAARQHAPRSRALGSDQLAEIAIDEAGSLTVRDRALLAVVIGDLVRMSRRDRSTGSGRQLNLFD